jgi:hypothetical protein
MSRYRFARVQVAPLLLGLGVLAACAKHDAKPALPNDDVIVAKVNGTKITRYDVDRITHHSLGELAFAASAENFPKLREAAVRSRAIALAAEAELSALQKLALAKEVEAYREQLLVRRYLNRHAPPAPVTPEMVRAYYQDHPERFGARTERTYDLLGSTRALAPQERDKLLTALKGVERESDWQTVAERLSHQGLPLALTTTTSWDKALDQRLRDALRQLEAGKTSPVTFVQGRVYLARTKGEEQTPPRPFEEVRVEIERMLTPNQLSDSIDAVSKQVLKQAKVELFDAKPAKPEAQP